MFKLKNSILRRAYKFLGRYIHARRYDMSLPLSVSLLDQKKSALSVLPSLEMSGHLRDISKTGLSLILPSMRFGDRFLITGHYPLRVMVELPNRVVSIQVAPVRYDKLKEEQSSERKYLVGARITQMTETDREHLTDYIQQMKRSGTGSLNFARDAKSI
jgi:hypothetical protein